jgi:hypothetical protein
MSLPKIEYPTFELTIPSTKKKVKHRPYFVKEEKILLMAQQTGNINEIISAMKQVINNCIVTEDFNVNSLMIFDVEYIFLRLRAVSVNNIITLTYKDNEDQKNYTVSLNLDDVDVKFDPDHTNKIQLSETMNLYLRYPGMELSDKVVNAPDTATSFFELVKSCLDKLTVSEEDMYIFSEMSDAEKEDFLNTLTPSAFNKIKTFFETMPKLSHTIRYTNSLGHEQEIVLETLNDFFTLV